MTTGSSVPTIKAQLVTKLSAELSESVHYSRPTSSAKKDFVFLGDVKDGRHDIPVMTAGRKKREEEYIVEVTFVSVRAGATSEDSETKCFTMLDELEDLLADDPSLGLSGSEPTLRLQIGDWYTDTAPDESARGWRCELTVDVDVRIRLS